MFLVISLPFWHSANARYRQLPSLNVYLPLTTPGVQSGGSSELLQYIISRGVKQIFCSTLDCLSGCIKALLPHEPHFCGLLVPVPLLEAVGRYHGAVILALPGPGILGLFVATL